MTLTIHNRVHHGPNATLPFHKLHERGRGDIANCQRSGSNKNRLHDGGKTGSSERVTERLNAEYEKGKFVYKKDRARY